MRIQERFPDLYRYVRSEAHPVRLATGIATAYLICLAVLLSLHDAEDPWFRMFGTVRWLQFLPLFLYGTTRAAASIFSERAERTWDFQRLTPLGSLEIAVGKLIGAPIFAYLLFLSTLPWTVMAVLFSPQVSLHSVWAYYRTPLAAAFFLLNAALISSAHSGDGKQGRLLYATGALLGFWGVLQFMGIGMERLLHGGGQKTLVFYGWTLSCELFLILSLLVFGVWSFFGAQWRVAEDLLEKRRFWRFPFFLAFLAWYLMGLEGVGGVNGGGVSPMDMEKLYRSGAGQAQNPAQAWGAIFHSLKSVAVLSQLGLFVYLGAFLRPERLDYWRRWLFMRRGRERLDRTPVWVTGYITTAVVAGAMMIRHAGEQELFLRVFPLMMVFLGRDLCFIQWCRFTRSRKAEGMAMIYLTLAYLLPPLLLAPFGLAQYPYLYLPVPDPRTGLLANLLPGFLQLALAAAFMLRPVIEKTGPD